MSLQGNNQPKMPFGAKALVALIGSLVVLVLLVIINPLVKVDATNRGLIFTWGALNKTVLEPGIHWRTPIMQSVKEVTIQPIQLDHRVEVGDDGAITKDNQTIGADLTVFYKYDLSRLPEMWEQYGTDKIESIITQNLRETFKGVVGSYDIFNLAVSQDEIRSKVWAGLKDKTVGYPFTITELKIVNYNWSDAFDDQIEATMKLAQQVKQSEQNKLKAEQDAQVGVKQAEAEKQIAITKAEGEKEAARLRAEAKALEGDGIKKYNEAIAQNWDIELKKLDLEIEKARVDKWDGHYVSEQNFTPIPVQSGSILGAGAVVK